MPRAAKPDFSDVFRSPVGSGVSLGGGSDRLDPGVDAR